MAKCFIKINCGLGNILFKIAAAYSYSLKHDKEFILYESMCFSDHEDFNQYKDSIFKNIRISKDPVPIAESIINRTYLFENLKKVNGDAKLYGAFLNPKFFEGNEEKIKSLFHISDYEFDGGGICSVHVRRGDFLNQDYFYKIIEPSYFKEASKKIPNKTKFLVFSNDINWCKETFTRRNGFSNFEVFEDKNPNYIDLSIMSKCDHNIISNSTFSWWSAFLNKNPDKIIVAPNKWYQEKGSKEFCAGEEEKYLNQLLSKSWKRI